MSDLKTISIRMPLELIEKIKEAGDKEMRSISNMALALITEALDNRK